MSDRTEEIARRAEAAKGPIRILCDEIGFTFDERLECSPMLIAFVRELVREIAGMRSLDEHFTGKEPSEGSATVLALAQKMLEAGTAESAKMVHEAADELNPEDAYPTDHLIDMLSSCASAIRFGLEHHRMSRHAASAAKHVWRRKYGVHLFDECTPAWENDWARQVMARAILSRLREAEAENARLREALRPFAEEGADPDYDDDTADSEGLWIGTRPKCVGKAAFTVGDLRRARAALDEKEKG